MKLSSEDNKVLNDLINHSDSRELIEYFKSQNVQQKKRDIINLLFTIINTLIAISTLIIAVVQLFQSNI